MIKDYSRNSIPPIPINIGTAIRESTHSCVYAHMSFCKPIGRAGCFFSLAYMRGQSESLEEILANSENALKYEKHMKQREIYCKCCRLCEESGFLATAKENS